MIYFFIYFLIFFLALCERLDDKNEISGILIKKTLYYYLAAGLVLFVGLRNEIGFDFFNYKAIYNSYPASFSLFFSRFEPGFNFILYLSKNLLGLSFNYFLLIVTFLSISVKVIFYKKYFAYPTTLLLFYYPLLIANDFGLFRQGLAISIILWALPAIKERRIFKFLLVWIAAVSFHYSALIFFPVYFLNRITVTAKRFWGVFLAGFIINAVHLSTVIFSILSIFFAGTFLGFIMNYMLEGYGVSENPLKYFLKPSTLIAVLLFFLYWFIARKKENIREEKDFEFTVFNSYFLLFLLLRLFDSISALSNRGSFFLETFEVVIFYYLIEYFKEKELKLIFFLFFIIYGIVRIYMVLVHAPFDEIGSEFGRYQIFSEFFGL